MSADIENLKRYLQNLEAQANEARKQLHKLLQADDSRRCQVEIYWNAERSSYVTRFYRGGETLYSHLTKKYSRALASVGIERANGLRPRVSWKDVDAGKTWTADVVVHGWYWDQHFTDKTNQLAQVIPFPKLRVGTK